MVGCDPCLFLITKYFHVHSAGFIIFHSDLAFFTANGIAQPNKQIIWNSSLVLDSEIHLEDTTGELIVLELWMYTLPWMLCMVIFNLLLHF